MKTTLYAIVPGETRDEAIENSHRAFLELCPADPEEPGGTNPIFDWYRLYADLAEDEDSIYPTPDDDGIYPTSEDETEELMDEIWDNMVEKFQSFEDQQSDYAGLFTPTRSREYLIYDERARPVLSSVHYSNLIKQDDHWVVAALFSW